MLEYMILFLNPQKYHKYQVGTVVGTEVGTEVGTVRALCGHCKGYVEPTPWLSARVE